MTDYLGPLTLGQTDTYVLEKFKVSSADDGITAELVITVQSATADALAVAIEVLAASCRAGNAYARSEPGVTNPVLYLVTACTKFEADETESAWLAFWQTLNVSLTLSAQPAGALTTLYNAQDVSAPTSVSLATLLGTNPTMLDVIIDDQSGRNMHSVYAALAPTALSDAKWLVLASALTWTTMSSGTGVTMWGNSCRWTTSATYRTAQLDTSQYPAGKYRLLVRASQEAGTGYVMDSQNAVAVAITGATQHLVVVGDLDLPVADTAPGVAANLTLSVKSDGTNDCIVNAFVFIPLDLGYFSWHHAVPTTEIDQLDVGPSGVFMDGICDATYLQGGILTARTLAAHTGTLVATDSPLPPYTANIIPAMTSATAPSGVASASGEYSAGYAAWKAFDHLNVAGGWALQSATGHLQYQFPVAHIITQYAITPGFADTSLEAPKTWTFKGSNNGSTWTTLDTQTNITDWGTGHTYRNVFPFANATAYAYFRLDITESNTPTWVNVGELEMMETVVGGGVWPADWGRTDAVDVSIGMPLAVQPSVDTGYRSYLAGSGRLFLPAGTNYCTNPSAEGDSNADGVANNWVKTAGTPSLVAGRLGGTAQRIYQTQASGNAFPGVFPADTPAAAEGETWIASFYALVTERPTESDSRCVFWLEARTSADEAVAYEMVSLASVSSSWVRYSIGLTMPASTAKVVFYSDHKIAGAGTLDLTFDDVLIEKSAVLTPYFDGSSPGCAWTGAANASTSTRTESVLSVPVSLGNSGTLAARFSSLGAAGVVANIALDFRLSSGIPFFYIGAGTLRTAKGWGDGELISSAGNIGAAGSLHSIVHRYSESTVDQTFDGSVSAQGVHAAITSSNVSVELGAGSNVVNIGLFVGPVAICPSRITDAETVLLDAGLTAGWNGRQVFDFFRDRGYHGTLVLPLETDSVGWVVP